MINGAAVRAMDESHRILIVDDDPALRRLVRDYLVDHGFNVFEAEGGHAMRRILEKERIDVAVVDVMMPGEDGLSIVRSMFRRGDLYIIMVSALGSETDRIIGLEVGADDYLPKPVSPRELLARIRALLRRQRPDVPDDETGGTYLFEGWNLDLARRVLRDPVNVVISLSDGEFSLLRVFTERPQRVLSRDQLLEYSRGSNSEAFDRAIDTQVSRLRRKLCTRTDVELIGTVRNEGYMFLPRVTRR